MENGMKDLGSRERELVALGAALASNCIPCIEYHVPAARKAGLSEAQIAEALRVAERVRQVPAKAVLESALARLGEDSPDSVGCGCDASAVPHGS